MASPVETFKLPCGMGALIRHSPNGPWTWQWYDKRRGKNVCTPTNELNRSKAEQWVYQQAAIRPSTGFRYQGLKVLFTTLAGEYVKARSEGVRCKKLRPTSIISLQTAIGAFKNFVGRSIESLAADAVDAELLQRFVDAEGARVATKTANAHLDVLGQILDFGVKKKCILHNPVTSVERIYDNEINEDDDEGLLGWPCPSPEEVRLILVNAKPVLVPTGAIAHNGSEGGRKVVRGINKNDYTDLYAAICLTGMRRNEARFLTWADVDLAGRVILIRPGRKNGILWQPKSRASIRRIAIVPELEVILNRLRATNRSNLWVFETKRGTQLHESNPTERLGEICQELKFEKRYVLHSLRKYWASTVAQQGMDWKVMLKMFGHSDFELILSTYYAQNDDARMVAEASRIDYGLGLPKTA